MSFFKKFLPKPSGSPVPENFAAGFIRRQGIYILDQNGSQIDVSQKLYGCIWFEYIRVKGDVREKFGIPGYFKRTGWFIYIEPGSSVWLFDGAKELNAVTMNGQLTVVSKEDYELCPQLVKDAIPAVARMILEYRVSAPFRSN